MRAAPAIRLTRAALASLLALSAPACGEQRQREARTAAPAMPAPQPALPALTGRVVDNADLLPSGTEVALTAKLASLEAGTRDQLVVATVPSLGGRSIEAFGLALGNGWGIGQKDLDNGVLLIVAPAERHVRIEVGSGLERVLSDEGAAQIIREDILPRFRAGQMEAGILAGTDAIIATLRANPRRTKPREKT